VRTGAPFIFALLIATTVAHAADAPTTRPNVLIILIDDHPSNLNDVDQKSPVPTPNMRRLAGRGTWFSRGYNDAPICCASRTALLTGVHATRSGIYYNNIAYKRAPNFIAKAITLPQQFMRNGYLTAGYGKIPHNAFVNDDITGPSDPLEHLRILELELALADLETVEKRLHQTQRQAKLDRGMAEEAANLQIAFEALAEGLPLYRAGLKDDVRDALAPYFLLTNRRVLAVVNVGEDELDTIPEAEARVAAEFNDAGDNVEVIGMCVQLEAEAAAITDPDERAEILEGFGLGEGALFRMVRSAYHLLGLRTYLTTGEKESRAWTFYEGSTAPECAGRIHSDFQRGFIRAEVIQWDELLGFGSWNAAKDAGKMRVEGKDYIAQDGDVMEFRFNV